MELMESEGAEQPHATAEAVVTSFPEVIMVHQLAQQCIQAATSRDRHLQPLSGSGLKQLRLVSKETRTVLLRSVQGYTLLLPRKPEHWGYEAWSDNHAEVNFLKSQDLLSLQISFPPICSLLRGGNKCACHGECTGDGERSVPIFFLSFLCPH